MHARHRCLEMKITTKVAKRIFQHAEVAYPGAPTWSNGETMIYKWTGDPRYVVCAMPSLDPPLIVTVLFNTPDYYERLGETFRVKEDACTTSTSD